jgi:hypothetical protein
VRAQAHAGLAGALRHAADVRLENVEVDDDGWSIEIWGQR